MNKNRTENYVDGEITEAKLDAALVAKVNGVGLNHTHADLAPLASPTFTGTVTGTFSGNLTGDVTGTASGNLTSASTLDATKLSGILPALDGSALTALNGTNIASGTVADARLSANVPLLNAGNVFTTGQTIGPSAGTYAFHVAPTSGVTAGLTAFFHDATATTGKTGVVIKAGAGDTNSTNLLNVQNNAGASVFSVTMNGTVSGATASFTTFYGSTLNNPANIDYARIVTGTAGTQVSRNVNDANPALLVNLAHASATANILTLQKAGATKSYIDNDGSFVSDVAAAGVVLKSANGHYWRVTVSDAGALAASDLGTTAP